MAAAARALNIMYRLAVPATAGAFLVSQSIFDVKGGTRAVIFDRLSGVKEDVINEGTHFLVPWLQRSVIFDVRTKPRNIATTTGSKDLQMVSLTLRVLHRPNVKALPKIYQVQSPTTSRFSIDDMLTVCRNLGVDYDERVLPSIGNEVLKAIVAQFDAAELITQREAVSQKIRTELTRRAAEFNIALEDVSITHMTFGREFTKAVEQKQIAQQDAERARFIVEKAEQERQANVIRAEGEAESAETISKAIAKNGDGLVQIRRLKRAGRLRSNCHRIPTWRICPRGSRVMEDSICCLLDGLKKCKKAVDEEGKLLRFCSDHVILYLENTNDDIFQPDPYLLRELGLLLCKRTDSSLNMKDPFSSSLYFSINASVNPPGFPGGQKCPSTNVHPALCISFHSFMIFNRTSSPAALASSAES
ncbi:Prohibitin-1, subunit of the prohibitin complex (Phb1p-Phb2p) [Metarhizium acridum]|nr:Prohibitin-1, subunit of the prohibitin complex (Phb1p-Phb2p) [Metarhizium acridum]